MRFFDYSGGMFAACPARGSVLPGLEVEVLHRAWDMCISHGCERRFCLLRGVRKRAPLQWIRLRRPPGRRSGQEKAGVQRDMKQSVEEHDMCIMGQSMKMEEEKVTQDNMV